jgi:hypothetical protein
MTRIKQLILKISLELNHKKEVFLKTIVFHHTAHCCTIRRSEHMEGNASCAAGLPEYVKVENSTKVSKLR